MYCKKNLDFVALIWEDLAYQIDNIDYKKQDKMFYPRFTKIIIYHFFEKDKSISMRNKTFMHTACDDNLLGTMRFVSRHADTQVYGAIIPKAMKNQALLDFVSYMTYYAIDSGAEPPKSRKIVAAKPKPTKKKALVKAERGKGLNVLSEVALSKAAQLKEATKRNKKDFHISQASSLGDGTDFESGVPDEQHHKTLGTNEGTSTKLRVPNVPNYDSESDKESWGDSEEEVDDEDDTKDDEENDDSDANNDDGNDDRIKILVLNQSSIEYEKEEEEEEKVDDEEKTNEEDDEITKELYKDVHVNLGNKYANLTDADQGGTGQQNVSQDVGGDRGAWRGVVVAVVSWDEGDEGGDKMMWRWRLLWCMVVGVWRLLEWTNGEWRRMVESGVGDRLDRVVGSLFGFAGNARRKSFPTAAAGNGG
nr:hypothetical protein [Tanacetum cinerariifolium]